MCIPKFEKDKEGYFKKIDELSIEAQIKDYPLETCVISGEKLGGEEMGDPYNHLHNGQLNQRQQPR